MVSEHDVIRSGGLEVLPGAGGDTINVFYDQAGHLRRLQPVQPGLPGRGLHHDEGSRHGEATDELE